MTDREAQARELAEQIEDIAARTWNLDAGVSMNDAVALILAYGDRCRAEAAMETEVGLQGHDRLTWSEREGIPTLTCGLCGGYFLLDAETPEQRLYRALKNEAYPLADNQASFLDPCPRADEEPEE